MTYTSKEEMDLIDDISCIVEGKNSDIVSKALFKALVGGIINTYPDPVEAIIEIRNKMDIIVDKLKDKDNK